MVDLIIFLTLLTLGYAFGRWAEYRHYRSIIKREGEFSHILTFATKIPASRQQTPESCLVQGSVVISIDYFKRFLAGLRALVGGKIKSYETLIDRARREAILRMKEDASGKGGDQIFNVKLETSSISKGRRDRIGSIEVLAYGTTLICASPAYPSMEINAEIQQSQDT